MPVSSTACGRTSLEEYFERWNQVGAFISEPAKTPYGRNGRVTIAGVYGYLPRCVIKPAPRGLAGARKRPAEQEECGLQRVTVPGSEVHLDGEG